MRAVQLVAPGDLEVRDAERPSPAPGQVLVRVGGAGVCHSDVHLVHAPKAPFPLPLTLGHEAAGEVDAVGDGVAGWEPGQRVSVTAGFGCGECAMCRADRQNICERGTTIPGIDIDGAQAHYVVVPARSLVALPDSVDFATGAILTDAVLTPYHAVRRAGVTAGQTAVVYGLGGLGLHAATILKQVVGAHVIGADTHPGALERALRFGVDEVVDGSGGKPGAEVRRLTGGGADHSFEFVGAAAATDQAVKSLRPGGTCTVVGLTPEPLTLLPQALLVSQELRLQGSFGGSLQELAELVSFVADGTLDLSGTITHRFPLERFDAGLRALETKDGDPIRVVIEQPG